MEITENTRLNINKIFFAAGSVIFTAVLGWNATLVLSLKEEMTEIRVHLQYMTQDRYTSKEAKKDQELSSKDREMIRGEIRSMQHNIQNLEKIHEN